MIDTDKYEGHTKGPWWIYHKDGDGVTSFWNGTIDEADMNHVADVDAHDSDLRLIADAPLLLAEVERLRSLAENLYDFYVGKYDGSLFLFEQQMYWREEE